MQENRGKLKRSISVSVIAWFFIALGGFATAISLALNILLQMIYEDGIQETFRWVQSVIEMPPAVVSEIDRLEMYKVHIQRIYPQVQSMIEIPPVVEFAINNFELIFPGFLLVSFFTWMSAIGLLMRVNGARIMLIALLSLGILWNIASCAFTYVLYDSIVIPLAEAEGRQPDVLIHAFLAATFMIAFISILLFSGIIRKLISPSIYDEFVNRALSRTPAHVTGAPQVDQERDLTPVPRGMHIDRPGSDLIISRRWFSFTFVFAAFFSIAGIGILTLSYMLGDKCQNIVDKKSVTTSWNKFEF